MLLEEVVIERLKEPETAAWKTGGGKRVSISSFESRRWEGEEVREGRDGKAEVDAG